MPSVSEPQARLMAAAAHDPKFAAEHHIPMSVAQEFNQADKGGSLLHKAMMNRQRMMGAQRGSNSNSPKR